MYTQTEELTEYKKQICGVSFNEDIVFFDIETTGFSDKTTFVYLIGCVYCKENTFHMIQWMAQNEHEEPKLLHSFFSFLQSYHIVIHFNGEGFDMPYLVRKCQKHQLPYHFNSFKSIDLYKAMVPYKKHLKLINLKQKTLEQFLQINREDRYSGKELIEVFLRHQQEPSQELLSALLQHNHDDLIGMMQLLPLLSYRSLFQGAVSKCSCGINTFVNSIGEEEQEALFTFELQTPIPRRISYGIGDIYLICNKNIGKLKVKVYTEELKYFFPNYQDYYYLPLEDSALHKSVSFYVDKNFRTKAKAANCYSKKTGRFLSQTETLISPYFKKDYHDKVTYFELTDEFMEQPKKQELYIKHILTTI